MNTLLHKIRLIFEDSTLRKRTLFVLGALAAFRILAAIPIPGINIQALAQFFANNQFLGLLNLFSGGGLDRVSIVMLGVAPYITGSIIMQLLTIIFPRLKEMYHEEGEAGRRKVAQYSRLLTVPLALIQGASFLTLLERSGTLIGLTPFTYGVNLAVITAGSLLLMWLGELITEYGIGNGVSILIFAGIVARLPSAFRQTLFTFTPDQLPVYIALVAAAVLITFGVVVVTEAERPIPITYAKRIRGAKVYGGISTYLPIRVNQAGVIPIIFALSILLFPQMLFNFLSAAHNELVQTFATLGTRILSNQWFYASAYFILVFLFTYFYTAITFEPDTMAENLQRNGAFVPGVRPGPSTAQHIGAIVTRLTLVGALFLGLIAVLPLAVRAATGITSVAIGGTALLIVVSVVIDLVKKVDAQVSMREY